MTNWVTCRPDWSAAAAAVPVLSNGAQATPARPGSATLRMCCVAGTGNRDPALQPGFNLNLNFGRLPALVKGSLTQLSLSATRRAAPGRGQLSHGANSHGQAARLHSKFDLENFC